MNFRSFMIPCVGLVALTFFSADLRAQVAGAPAPASSTGASIRVAIANPGRILVEMAETKDLRTKIQAELKSLDQMKNEKQTQLQDLQTSRNNLRPDSPQWQERNKELMQKAIEFDVWVKMTQADVQRHEKEQLKALFNKIQMAIGDVAREQNFDLVISDQRSDFPDNLDQISAEQLRQMINQRIVLFANEKVDITATVIARLDLQYSKGGK